MVASRASREELLFRWRPGWWVVPLGIAYSVAIRFALLVVITVVVIILLTTHASTPETLQGFVRANRPNVETLVSVSAMRNNPSYFWLAVTLIALLFRAMHLGMGPIAAAMAGVLGWLLGMIMVLHKSIWPAVIAHGLFDATTMTMVPWVLEKFQHLR